MEEKKTTSREPIKALAFIMTLLLSVVLLLVFGAHTYRLPIFGGTNDYHETGWFFGEKGGNLSPVKLSDQQLIEPGKTYLLTTTLTYTGEGDDYPSALFTSGNYELEVYLDGKLMFRYTREERGLPLLKGMGGAAFTIPLGDHPEGKVLTLELTTSMDYALERRMPGILLGDHSAHMRSLLLQNIPSILISMAIFFVAVVLILLGNADPRKRWAYLFFSVFALIIVVYRASQDLFLMYMWANPVLSVFLEFFSLVVCPLPVLLSYRFEMKPYFRNTFAVLIGITVLNILGQLILHITGTRDLVQNLKVTHIWILICTVSLILIDLRVRKMDPNVHCMRKLIPILIGAALDFFLFYVKTHTIGPGSLFVVGNFIGLGLLTSLCMMVWEARKDRERAYAASERSKLLERIAYEDTLTGIANRAAFTREIGEIQAGVHSDRRILAVEADLNDLKKTNDNLGHTAGDDLIRRAAGLLRDVFEGYGKVYRTGGDEFFAILYDVSEDQWQTLRQVFDAELKKRNQESSLPLSIAIGHSFVEESIEKSIQLADKRMYQNKTEIKASEDYGFCNL